MIKSTKEHNVIASFAHGLLMLNFYNSRKYKVIDCRLRWLYSIHTLPQVVRTPYVVKTLLSGLCSVTNCCSLYTGVITMSHEAFPSLHLLSEKTITSLPFSWQFYFFTLFCISLKLKYLMNLQTCFMWGIFLYFNQYCGKNLFEICSYSREHCKNIFFFWNSLLWFWKSHSNGSSIIYWH